jgi:ABC-2 type transport system permease protein
MTAVTAPPRGSQPGSTQLRTGRLRDAVVLLRRNLVHMAREPLRLSEFTVQPVLFTLLFVYIFGSGVPVTGGYPAFAIAGLLAMNLVTSAIGTGIGLSADLATGVISRFRTLPMWRPAILVGRSACDLLTATLCTAMVAATGLAIGWRPASNIADIVAGFAIFLLFSCALSWGCACLGLIGKSPESAQGLGLVILFPLAIVSNALVPTAHMPAPIRLVADWNPVSAVTAAARHLWANPNPSEAIHAWPMQHPVAAALIWSVALIAILAPLATALYRRRTAG